MKSHISEFYNIIRVVESTFRCLKTELGLRPVYHKGDDGTKEHLNLAILAYWVVSTVQYQLRLQNIHTDWRESTNTRYSQSGKYRLSIECLTSMRFQYEEENM